MRDLSARISAPLTAEERARRDKALAAQISPTPLTSVPTADKPAAPSPPHKVPVGAPNNEENNALDVTAINLDTQAEIRS